MEPTTAPAKPQFSPAAQAEIKRLLTHYPADKSKSALLPILHIAQAEFGGWVSPEVQDLVAETLSIKPIEVYEVSSFYTQYNLKPVGKHVLEGIGRGITDPLSRGVAGDAAPVTAASYGAADALSRP